MPGWYHLPAVRAAAAAYKDLHISIEHSCRTIELAVMATPTLELAEVGNELTEYSMFGRLKLPCSTTGSRSLSRPEAGAGGQGGAGQGS